MQDREVVSRCFFKSVYLSGKREYDNWHLGGVEDLNYVACKDGEDPCPWPVLPAAIFHELDYTGPFFLQANSSTIHAEATNTYENLLGPSRHVSMIANCQKAIERADFLFAWIDYPPCSRTLLEVGYAKAIGKPLIIAGKKKYHEVRFTYELATQILIGQHYTPLTALKQAIVDHSHYIFASPIEQKFWEQWIASFPLEPLIPQYRIGKYRVDFAHIETQTAIELDGFASHSTTTNIAYDRKRQRAIEAHSWYVIRFGGKEIHHYAAACVLEAKQIIDKHKRAQRVQSQAIIDRNQEQRAAMLSEGEPPSLPLITIHEKWEAVKNHLKRQKGGPFLVTLLNKVAIESMQNTRTGPLLLLRAPADSYYTQLHRYKAHLVSAIHLQLGSAYQVQVLPPLRPSSLIPDP